MRKAKTPTRVTQHTYTVAGVTMVVPAAPWCDCDNIGVGFTKRDDGCWVRPCCMRRTQQVWIEHGDTPFVPSGNGRTA